METPTTLILDGIWGRPGRWETLRRRIEKDVGPATIYRYRSSGMTSLKTLGLGLADHAMSLGTPVNFVAHSMGGLVVRSAIRQEPRLRVGRVCMMCSPLSGTLMAYGLPLKAVREMRPGSGFLRWLAESDDRWNWPTMCVWCRGDLMILPNRSSDFARATERLVSPVPAHNWPRWSVGLQRRVVEFLGKPS
jgi:pimeloyl-ACP methyl ester carboxylesterase